MNWTGGSFAVQGQGECSTYNDFARHCYRGPGKPLSCLDEVWIWFGFRVLLVCTLILQGLVWFVFCLVYVCNLFATNPTNAFC